MFLQFASGSTRKSAETQTAGFIRVPGDIHAFLFRALWFLRVVERGAAIVQDRATNRRLRNLRWCDSTERALLEDSLGLRRNP
jgi:hypothetical protein